jgi:hypothetical protein
MIDMLCYRSEYMAYAKMLCYRRLKPDQYSVSSIVILVPSQGYPDPMFFLCTLWDNSSTIIRILQNLNLLDSIKLKFYHFDYYVTHVLPLHWNNSCMTGRIKSLLLLMYEAQNLPNAQRLLKPFRTLKIFLCLHTTPCHLMLCNHA